MAQVPPTGTMDDDDDFFRAFLEDDTDEDLGGAALPELPNLAWDVRGPSARPDAPGTGGDLPQDLPPLDASPSSEAPPLGAPLDPREEDDDDVPLSWGFIESDGPSLPPRASDDEASSSALMEELDDENSLLQEGGTPDDEEEEETFSWGDAEDDYEEPSGEAFSAVSSEDISDEDEEDISTSEALFAPRRKSGAQQELTVEKSSKASQKNAPQDKKSWKDRLTSFKEQVLSEIGDDSSEPREAKKTSRGSAGVATGDPLKIPAPLGKVWGLITWPFRALAGGFLRLLTFITGILGRLPLVGHLFTAVEGSTALKVLSFLIPVILLGAWGYNTHQGAVAPSYSASLPDEGSALIASLAYSPDGRAYGVITNTGEIIVEVKASFQVHTSTWKNPWTFVRPSITEVCSTPPTALGPGKSVVISTPCPLKHGGVLPLVGAALK